MEKNLCSLFGAGCEELSQSVRKERYHWHSMNKQLEYFQIDGEFGGNQDWFTNIVMHVGGCAAATACDSCIYFALTQGREELYPYDISKLSKEHYKAFSMKMKPYLRPRRSGINKPEIYIEGFQEYLGDIGAALGMEPFSGERSFEEARAFVINQIDLGYPIPYLLLRHKDKKTFEDFIWHWFLLVGYEEREDDLMVTTATYGEALTFSLRKMWDTGYEEKGGMVKYFHIFNREVPEGFTKEA